MRQFLVGLFLGGIIAYVVGFTHGAAKPVFVRTERALDQFSHGVDTFDEFKVSVEKRFDDLIHHIEHPFKEGEGPPPPR